jgi:hypothetical protein
MANNSSAENNIAPTGLKIFCVQKFYDDFAPMELIFTVECQVV